MSLKAGIEASRPAFEPKRGGHTEEKTGKPPQFMKVKVIVLLPNQAHKVQYSTVGPRLIGPIGTKDFSTF